MFNLKSQHKKRIIRSGHTLIEVLLVLAIMAVVMAMAIPTYESLVSARRLQKSAESLEIQLQEARVTAMRTGQSQVFRFSIGSDTYTCEAWLSGTEEMNSGPGATLQDISGQLIETGRNVSEGNSIADVAKGSKKLEEGIQFASANTTSDSRTTYAQMQAGELSATGPSVSTPIMFYPDGTATTAEIVLQGPNGEQRAIQIRGLTGRTKLVAVESAPSM